MYKIKAPKSIWPELDCNYLYENLKVTEITRVDKEKYWIINADVTYTPPNEPSLFYVAIIGTARSEKEALLMKYMVDNHEQRYS